MMKSNLTAVTVALGFAAAMSAAAAHESAFSVCGGNDVTRPSDASSAAADRWISRLADHRGGVHHVGGSVRRSCSAGAATQQYHFLFDVAAN